MFDKKDQKGQSLVEVALTLPIIVLLLAGILDLGWAYFTYVAMSDAAAEGASYASLHPVDEDQIIQRAANSSTGLVEFDPALISVEVGTISTGNPITVTVGHQYQMLTPIMAAFVPGGVISMRATAVQTIMNDL